MSKKTKPPDFEKAGAPGTFYDGFSWPMKCLGCDTVMPEGETSRHAENCTLLHMRRVLSKKNDRRNR